MVHLLGTVCRRIGCCARTSGYLRRPENGQLNLNPMLRMPLQAFALRHIDSVIDSRKNMCEDIQRLVKECVCMLRRLCHRESLNQEDSQHYLDYFAWRSNPFSSLLCCLN